MRGFSQHLAWDLAYGSSQAMPAGSGMTGLKGQEETGGQAGLMSLGPQGSWHPTLHPGCSWASPWLSYCTQSQPCFLPLGQAPPESWGQGKGSLEEHKEPGLGSLPRFVGGQETLSLRGTEQGHCASEGRVLAPDEAHLPHVWWVLCKVCRVTHGVNGDAGET